MCQVNALLTYFLSRHVYVDKMLLSGSESRLYEIYMICILYGFPCEMDFSPHNSPVVRNLSCMENHTKGIFWHTLHLKRHVSHAKYTARS